MDIGGWLRSLGLAKYEAAFRENEIDETVLESLTHENLKELGVTALGHRLKLLDAIAALHVAQDAKEPQPASASTLRSAAVATATPVQEATGERRHVTVMFCDLVDSTGIAARLDAEEWRDLVGAYLDAASVAITEMGGHIRQGRGRSPDDHLRDHRVAVNGSNISLAVVVIRFGGPPCRAWPAR
jgi:class 3 adenylate cyclase